MGISVRKRRRIQYGGQNYIWWVVPNDDDCDQIYLNIISEDKKNYSCMSNWRRKLYCHKQGAVLSGTENFRLLGVS